MMCSCDQEHGERFLPHQLRTGTELKTKQRFKVTLGFQPHTCNQCRGLPAVLAPVSAQRGRTSKITRYYWREIAFETTRQFHAKYPSGDEWAKPDERRAIEREVLERIKVLHAQCPKYVWNEPSQQEVIEQTKTEVVHVHVKHVPQLGEKVLIESGGALLSVEDFAVRYFSDQGYQCITTESRPFHALFGLFMYLLIEDPDDPRNRIVQFSSRTAYENNQDAGASLELISIFLPEDFGTSGYFERREKQIESHLATICDLDWLFTYWTRDSWRLREYLWAHRPKDLEKAKAVMTVLGEDNLKTVLRYLVRDYWEHYLGWPDLLIHRPGELCFVEVKSSKDKLSDDQKNWMLGNQRHMHLPFKILKLCAS